MNEVLDLLLYLEISKESQRVPLVDSVFALLAAN